MSGPIIRKYGFPNFEKIFGERNLDHGVDDEGAEAAETTPPEPEASAEPAKKPAAKPKKKKS